MFDRRDHYWTVAGDASRVWSSAAAAYVAADDGGYAAWGAAGGEATMIANEFELDQVLRRYGLSIGRAFTAEEALAALVAIDAGQVKAALGREDVGPQALRAGDADTLRALTMALAPAGGALPEIEGATQPMTTDERLAKLERDRTSP